MHKTKLKIVSLLLTVFFVFSIFPSYICLADTIASGTCGDDITWSLDDDGTLFITGSGAMPDWIFDNPAPWYSYKDNIDTVIISDGITSIGALSFLELSNLTNVELPNSLLSIDDGAFYNCSNLTSITIPSSVTSIGACAFYECSSLSSIEIPSSVSEIGEEAFYGCDKLPNDTIVVAGSCNENIRWTLNRAGVLTIIGSGAMPDWIFDNPAPWYSYKDNIDTVIISDGITSIGELSFLELSNLTNVELPNSLLSIDDGAFYNCSNLTSITIPSSVTSIGACAFYECSSLSSIEIPSSVTEIEEDAFYGCDRLPADTIVIASYCNENIRWTLNRAGVLIIIGSGDMPDWFFDNPAPWYSYKDNIDTVIISDGITSIGSCSFLELSNLTNVELPNSLLSIDDGAFYNCSNLTSITIPSSVTSIGACAFYECSSLSSIEIPSSVSEIGEEAFFRCDKLPNDTIVVAGSCNENIRWTLNRAGVLTIIGSGDMPDWTYYDFDLAPWERYRNSIHSVIISENITKVGNYSFCNYAGITRVILPVTLETIGKGAFQNCTGLTEISIPENVTLIDEYAFAGCTGFTEIILPEHLNSIERCAFSGCTNLVDVYMPESIGEIDKEAFSSCDNLSPDTIIAAGRCGYSTVFWRVRKSGVLIFTGSGDMPDWSNGSAENAAPWAQYYNMIDSVVFYGDITRIGAFSFYDFAGLSDVEFPDSLVSIGNAAFGNCQGLTKIDLPYSVTSLGAGAFYNCQNLKNVVLNKAAYREEAFLNSDSVRLHYYYDVEYSNNGLGNIYGKTRTYGTDSFEISFEPDPNMVLDQIMWSDGSSQVELTPDQEGKYTMPDSDCDVTVTALFKCREHTIVTDPGVEPDLTHTGLTEGSHCSVCGEILVAQEVIPALGHSEECDDLIWTLDEDGLLTIYCSGNMCDYSTFSTPWSDHADEIRSVVFVGDVTSIGDYAFYGCVNLTDVIIPDTVTLISNGAFCGCQSLESIKIPESVNKIGACAFAGCTSLSYIDIPDSVYSIEYRVFNNCQSLRSIYIPYAVTSLENDTFYGCDELSFVVINRDAYNPDAFPAGFSTEYIHYYYDVEYTDNGFGKIAGKTRTYGTDPVIFSVDPDPNMKLNKVMWSNGGSQVELFPDAYGFYTMPDSDRSVTITAVFTCLEHTIVIDPGIEADTLHPGLTEGQHCAVCGEVLVAQEEIPAKGHSGTCGENLSWVLDENGVLTISGTGDMYDWENENDIAWWPYKEDILSIVFNGEITSIGIGAFPCCTNLTSITIPESVTSIGAASFVGCNNLTNVEIPDSVTEIGFRAFQDCRNLSSIVIPYGVTTLENVTFYGCESLRSVVINRDAYNPNAFPSGFSSEYIHYYYDVEYKDNGLGTIYGKTRTYGTDSFEISFEPDPNMVLDQIMWSDGSSQVELTPDQEGKYTMPDSGSDVSITAYFKCDAHFAVIDPAVEPDCTHPGLTEGSHCSVCGEVLVAQEEVAAQGHVPVTDPRVEPDCTHTGLTEGSHCSVCGEVLVAQEEVAALGHVPVTDPGVEPDLTHPGLTEGSHCSVCGEVLVAQEEIPAKGHSGTCGENLSWVLDENGVLTISGTGDMYNWENENDIAWWPYKEDILSIEFNGEITSIGSFAFSCCNNLTNIEIPDSVTEIGFGAFRDCRNLSSIVIPYGVTALEAVTFYGCDGLSSIVINRDAYNPDAFLSGFSTEYIHYYYDVEYTDNGFGTISGKTRTYGTDTVAFTVDPDPNMQLNKVMWINNNSQVEIFPDEYGFYTMPDSDNNVAIKAFFTCIEHTIVIDPGVEPDTLHPGLTEGQHCSVCGEVLVAQEEIPAKGHSGTCGENLSWVLDENGVLTISGTGDMYDWENENDIAWWPYKEDILSIEFNGEITSIGIGAFPCCTNLTSISIPDTVTSIGAASFVGCNNLTNVEIPDSVTEIGFRAFHDCRSLSSIVIPYGVTTLENVTFYGCESLRSVVINRDAYNPNAFPAGFSSEYIHFYYDVEYTDNGLGTISGKTRTYGTDSVVYSVECEPNLKLDKIMWSNGSSQVELTPDQEGKYTMPDSGSDVTITAYFKCDAHFAVIDPAVEPDCTHPGLTEGSHCSVCGEVLVAQEEVAAQGHVPVTDPRVEPDLTHPGLTEGSHCSVCGEILVAQEEIFVDPLEIVTQPVDYTGKIGDTATFSVTAQGKDLAYRWQTYKSGKWTNSSLPGSDTASLSAGITSSRDGYRFRCVITDTYGQTVTSGEAVLHAVAPILISSQPEDYIGVIGSTATFSVAAQGKELSYQWQTYKSGKWSNSSLPGSDTATLSAGITNSRNGYKFRCIISDAYGQSVTSDEAVLHAVEQISITSQPEDYTGVIGSTATFKVTAQGTDLSYQWQTYKSGKWSNSSLPGSNTATLSAGITSSRDGYKFRCVITDSYGQTATSGEATLHATVALAIVSQPVDYTGAVGDTAVFKVIAQGTGLNYQWQTYKSGKWANSSLPGSNTATLSAGITNSRNGYKFRCVITDAYNKTVTSDEVTLHATAPLSIVTQPKDYTGAVGETATFKVIAQGTGLSYQWQTYKSGKWANSSLPGSNTATLSAGITNSRDGYKFRCVITDAYDQSVTSNAAVLHVGASLSITSQPKDFVGPAGSTAKFKVTAQGTGLSYQWQTYKSGKWTNSSLPGSNTATLSVGVTNSRNGYQFRCVVTDASGKTVTSNAATLIVDNSLTSNTAVSTVNAPSTLGLIENDEEQAITVPDQQEKVFGEPEDAVESVISDVTEEDAFDTIKTADDPDETLTVADKEADAVDTVSASEVTIKTKPSGTGKAGDKVTLEVTAEGEGLKYQWQYFKDGKWIDVEAEGADKAEFSIEMTEDLLGTQYRCVITDSAENTVVSDEVIFSI